jgi:hypothetical protein
VALTFMSGTVGPESAPELDGVVDPADAVTVLAVDVLGPVAVGSDEVAAEVAEDGAAESPVEVEDESDAPSSAVARPAPVPVAIATPTPRATARAPILPTCRA